MRQSSLAVDGAVDHIEFQHIAHEPAQCPQGPHERRPVEIVNMKPAHHGRGGAQCSPPGPAAARTRQARPPPAADTADGDIIVITVASLSVTVHGPTR